MVEWYKQEERDIYDEEATWESTKYVCLMKDGTYQEFYSFLDETMDGDINHHVWCTANDDYDVDDILYWSKVQ